MTGIDTNLLVRYFVKDDEEQYLQVKAFFNRKLDAQEALFISDAVLCELVWVLSRGYRHSKADIIRILELISRSAGLTFQSPLGLRRAVKAFGVGRGDFADYIIRERAFEAGCQEIATLDKALSGETGFIKP